MEVPDTVEVGLTDTSPPVPREDGLLEYVTDTVADTVEELETRSIVPDTVGEGLLVRERDTEPVELCDTVREALALADAQPLVDRLLELTKLGLVKILGVKSPTDTVWDMVEERERVGDTVDEAEEPTDEVTLGDADVEMLLVILTEGVGERDAEGVKVDEIEEDTLAEYETVSVPDIVEVLDRVNARVVAIAELDPDFVAEDVWLRERVVHLVTEEQAEGERDMVFVPLPLVLGVTLEQGVLEVV